MTRMEQLALAARVPQVLVAVKLAAVELVVVTMGAAICSVTALVLVRVTA